MITCAVAGAGLLAGIFSPFLGWRQRSAARLSCERLRQDMEQRHEECLRRIDRVREDLATSERAAQSSVELLSDGRLTMPARARALRMLRSGMSPETAARELGLGRHEVELLAKVATLLATNN